MKIGKLQGGLGNQMFQYATTRALEGDQMKKIYLDLSFLYKNTIATDTFTPRNFELDIFNNIRAKKLNSLQEKALFSNKILYRLFRKVFNLEITNIRQIENEFVFLPKTKNIYLDGYFQSEKYFSSIRKNLLEDFTFPDLDKRNEELKKKIDTGNSVSLHIRRGDYIKSENVLKYHGVLSLDYYKKAIALLSKEESESLEFYIFSDDPEYAKENFAFLPNKQIIDWNTGKDSWKDMALMQACKHHIVANSSFSWWGAWLSCKDGINIAPSNWFCESVSFDIHDFIPYNWHLIHE